MSAHHRYEWPPQDLRAHRVGCDLRELGVRLRGDRRWNRQLEGLSERSAGRCREDNHRRRPDARREDRDGSAPLGPTEEDETAVPPRQALLLRQHPLVVGGPLTHRVMRIERRGTPGHRIFRRVVGEHAVFLHRDHREIGQQPLRAFDVRVLRRRETAGALREDQDTLPRRDILPVQGPVDQAAVISPGRQMHGGSLRWSPREQHDGCRCQCRSSKHRHRAR
jgi:hypothetical protein